MITHTVPHLPSAPPLQEKVLPLQGMASTSQVEGFPGASVFYDLNALNPWSIEWPSEHEVCFGRIAVRCSRVKVIISIKENVD